MIQRKFDDYLIDIVSEIKNIVNFIDGYIYEDFVDDLKTTNAVIRSLEVIGEASKKIPDDIKNKYNNIPWKYMSGMRNKLIHEYFGVDIRIVWMVSTNELPSLLPDIENIIKKEIQSN